MMTNDLVLSHFESSLIPLNERVVVAFSGGVDSTVCVDVLNHARPDLRLFAYYLDHGIRLDTHVDIDHVRAFCAKRDIEVKIDMADIPAIARERKQSIEEAGRSVRYERLSQLADEKQCRYIVTAHHADDQVESILMQFLKGTSGLRLGIHAKAVLPSDETLIRPMLNMSKADILNYAEVHQLDYVDDSTNEGTDFIRNKLRNIVLPMIRNMINPSVDKALLRFKQLSDDMSAFLDAELETRWNQIVVDNVIRVRRLSVETRFIQTEIIKRYMREACPLYRLTYERLQELLDFILADRPPASYDLAGQWLMKRARRQAWVEEQSWVC